MGAEMHWRSDHVSFINFKRDYEDGMYILDPEHQRNVVHNDDWKSGIIESGLTIKDIPTVYFHTVRKKNKDGEFVERYESLDGKQRCHAVYDFLKEGDKESPAYRYRLQKPEWLYNKYFKDLTGEQAQLVKSCQLHIKILNREMTKEEIAHFFSKRQEAKPTTLGEHLNSNVSSNIREQVVHMMCDEELKQLMQKFVNDNNRHNFMEIVAQMMYYLQNGKESKNTETILSWWGNTHIEENKISEYKEQIKNVIRFLSSIKFPYKHTKTVYLPFLHFCKTESERLEQFRAKYEKESFKFSDVNGKHDAVSRRIKELCKWLE